MLAPPTGLTLCAQVPDFTDDIATTLKEAQAYKRIAYARARGRSRKKDKSGYFALALTAGSF